MSESLGKNMSESEVGVMRLLIFAGFLFFVSSLVFNELLGGTMALVIGINGATFMIYSAIIFHAVYTKGDKK